MAPSCRTASARSSGLVSVCAADSSRSFSPEDANARRMRRFTSTSVDELYTSASVARLSRLPLAPRYWMARLWSSGVELPLAMLVRTSRDRGTVHLREHVERLALQPRRTGAAQLLLDDGHGGGRVAVGERVEREDLQIFVSLRLRADSARRAADLDFERFRFLDVAARRIALGELGDRRQRLGALPEAILRVRLPVER